MTTATEYSLGRFRGVPFYIDDGDLSGGRRVASSQFPLRETPFTQDLGRRQRELSLNLVLVGNGARGDARRYASVEAWREALLQALEAPGPGQLEHPRYGTLSMQVDTFRAPDDLRKHNVVYLSVSFVEPGTETLRSREVPFVLVNAQADAVQVVAQAAFVKALAVSGQPVSVLQKALAAGQAVMAVVGEIRAIASRAQAMATRLQGLLATPAALAASVVSSVRMVQGSVFSPLDMLRGQADLLRRLVGRSPITPASASGQVNQVAARNEAAFVAVLAAASVAESARLLSGAVVLEGGGSAPGVAFASADEALAARDAFLALVDDVEALVPDDVFSAMRTLRAEVIRDLGSRAANMARVRRLQLEASVPAVVLAHQLYGDATRAGEVCQRNRLRHPLFVPAAIDLEVLNV